MIHLVWVTINGCCLKIKAYGSNFVERVGGNVKIRLNPLQKSGDSSEGSRVQGVKGSSEIQKGVKHGGWEG